MVFKPVLHDVSEFLGKRYSSSGPSAFNSFSFSNSDYVAVKVEIGTIGSHKFASSCPCESSHRKHWVDKVVVCILLGVVEQLVDFRASEIETVPKSVRIMEVKLPHFNLTLDLRPSLKRWFLVCLWIAEPSVRKWPGNKRDRCRPSPKAAQCSDLLTDCCCGNGFSRRVRFSTIAISLIQEILSLLFASFVDIRLKPLASQFG